MRRRTFLQLSAAGALLLSSNGRAAVGYGADVVVYGGTAAGVAAAVAAARGGASVTLLEPGTHLGGMVSGGLGHTDTGKVETIGGIALEFFQKVGGHYGQEVSWDFEPHVAEEVLRQLVSDAGVSVLYRCRLREHGGVEKQRLRVRRIFTEDGVPFDGRVFIDASYEGDLMAQAGASFTWGREGREEYNESFAGVRSVDKYAQHRFDTAVSAYDSGSTLLPDISVAPRGAIGAGDRKVQAYNFRLCLTKNKANQVPIPKPGRYDARRYTLLARILPNEMAKHPNFPWIMIASPLPSGKTDINNYGAFSTDFINGSWEYPNASYRRREQLWVEHADYIAGFFHFLKNDPQVPAGLRSEVQEWGLAADEFTDTGNWPFQLYVREARRMIGDYVMTQHDMETAVTKDDVIGMGSYAMDSHNVQRYLREDGTVQNEGDTQVPTVPFQIPYRTIIPKQSECRNLLVPVCTSATHVAYGALRLEPVYMIMGEAAGVAAKIAIDQVTDVQRVDTRKLTSVLSLKGTVMAWTSPKG